MTDSLTAPDTVEYTEDGKPKLPSGINVLTILTFIGSGLGLVFVLLTPVINKFFLGLMEKARSSGKEFTAKELEEMEKGKSLIELSQANLVPLMIIGLLSIILCIVGAIWMRKLKKDGFWIYTGGELFPLIGNFILLGTAQFTGVVSVILGVGIPVIFVILYAMQRKYLVK
ncbi:MAG: hypothetical protein H7Z13_17785 [Ferruginibacter sp.]|nr:hypothetical protein [Ferruginibacter sp.]